MPSSIRARGQGRRLLAAVVSHAFEVTNVHRLVIGLFPDNLRARRMYEAIGFQAEGISRGSAYFGGEHRDELVMSLLRPEWQAANA
ncbi:GNAT family N-acetyltransferase [Mesorhizobium retamae]|uniref:GNAT family N-acetyltransferase n=1 Tax=Mesorhizobium retamae TaxID=2912854 RepID=A0ABS9QCD8_9HYPH|nr:GNAT family protein [Mesorhizobium sp. IRAMC:0171]MCG7504299.1 GNAT family N-acetyltransferase [Mesorhizobium sp. IRAMC:0171]